MSSQQYHEPLDGEGIRMSHKDEAIEVPQTFPSADWCIAWCQIASAHPDFGEVASRLEGFWKINIARDRSGPGAIWTLNISSESSSVTYIDPENTQQIDTIRATVSTKYGTVKRIIEGELDPLMAVLLRRIKIEGDVGELRSLGTRVKPLIASLRQVPTVYVC